MDTPQKSSHLKMVGRGLTDGAQHPRKNLKKENPYYWEVQRPKNLRRAWNAVYQNGIRSSNTKLRDKAKDFRSNEDLHLRRIHDELHKEVWEFEAQFGAPKKRSGKSSRPIVIYPPPNSIVQRSILDILQENILIRPYFETKTSFGAVKKRSVRHALQAVFESFRRGATFYIRSDIGDFFSNVPREAVISKIHGAFRDDKFINLLTSATAVELVNMKELKEDAALYPDEIGLAQGCCLSPLLGNILLSDFDAEMNDGSITCLRYIDDFIILGPTHESVTSAFRKANTILKSHGLLAYSPFSENTKASIGSVKKGFEFLGCDIRPFIISPSRKTRNRILKGIKEVLNDSLRSMKKSDEVWKKRGALANALLSVSNKLEGWGNQYSFCSDRNIFRDMDRKIDECLDDYLRKYRLIYGSAGEKDKRRLLGVHLLEDSKCSPIS